MALKWAGILVAIVAVTATATANILAGTDTGVPVAANLVGVTTAAAGAIVAIVAELYVRVDTKLDRILELVITRFDELDAGTGDRNTGFVEGYLAGHPPERSVLPLAPRGRRVAGMGDE